MPNAAFRDHLPNLYPFGDIQNARESVEAALKLDEAKTSTRWLNRLIKAFMGCGTKRASRLAAAIKLALHESVEVDEFADFLAARPKEANFVEEYRAAAAPKRAKNAPGSEASLEDDLPTSSQAEGHSVPKKIEEFKIVAANDTLSKQWARGTGKSRAVEHDFEAVFDGPDRQKRCYSHKNHNTKAVS